MAVRIEPGEAVEVYQGLFQRTLVKVEAAARRARVDWTPSKSAANPFGALQGGLVATVLDETAVLAAYVLSGGTTLYPAHSFHVDFMGPTPCAPLACFGAVRREGKSTAFLESWITTAPDAPDDRAAWLAAMTLTCRPVGVG